MCAMSATFLYFVSLSAFDSARVVLHVWLFALGDAYIWLYLFTTNVRLNLTDYASCKIEECLHDAIIIVNIHHHHHHHHHHHQSGSTTCSESSLCRRTPLCRPCCSTPRCAPRWPPAGSGCTCTAPRATRCPSRLWARSRRCGCPCSCSWLGSSG